jgi:uncharacterized low-complexity protein
MKKFLFSTLVTLSLIALVGCANTTPSMSAKKCTSGKCGGDVPAKKCASGKCGSAKKCGS